MRNDGTRKAAAGWCLCFAVGAVCGIIASSACRQAAVAGDGLAESTSADQHVEYYTELVLQNGWHPAGRGRISPQKAQGNPNVYAFVHQGDRLKAVYKGDSLQVVYFGAVVLHPEINPYGAGPFVIDVSDGMPKGARNFVQSRQSPTIYAGFDAKGRLTEYTAVRVDTAGRETSSFRCTYTGDGLLAERETIGVDEVGLHTGEIRSERRYDDKGRVVFEVVCYAYQTIGRVVDWNKPLRIRETCAIRLHNGVYRVRDESGSAEWTLSDTLPDEFREYVSELPIPPEEESGTPF